MIDLLRELAGFGQQKGADEIEIMCQANTSVKVGCRLQKLEIAQTSDALDVGIRVIQNKRQVFVSTSDVAPSSLKKQIEAAIEIVKYLPEDPLARLIQEGFSKDFIHDDRYFDPSNPSITDLFQIAKETEDAALSTHGITNSDGASSQSAVSNKIIVSSNGFSGQYQKSFFSTMVSVVAGEGENMKTDYDYDTVLFFNQLRQAKEIGEKAARKALGKLGSGKIKTGEIPIIFDKHVGKQVFRSFLRAINGKSIAQKTSFLKEDLHKSLFPKGFFMTDAPFLEGKIGSRPFDDEGVIGKDLEIIADGILKTWILDHTSAVKLGLKTTGHSSRSLSGPSFPSTTNIQIQGNLHNLDDLMRDITLGFYVTDLMGEGGSSITGDFSSGAEGFLIENGRITTPIHEATLGGHLREIFSTLILGNDFESKGGIHSPSFMIPKMTVGGA